MKLSLHLDLMNALFERAEAIRYQQPRAELISIGNASRETARHWK